VAGLNAERGRWSASVPGQWQQVRRAPFSIPPMQCSTGLARADCYWGPRREGYVMHGSTSAGSELWDNLRRAVCRVRHPQPAAAHRVPCTRAFEVTVCPARAAYRTASRTGAPRGTTGRPSRACSGRCQPGRPLQACILLSTWVRPAAAPGLVPYTQCRTCALRVPHISRHA